MAEDIECPKCGGVILLTDRVVKDDVDIEVREWTGDAGG